MGYSLKNLNIAFVRSLRCLVGCGEKLSTYKPAEEAFLKLNIFEEKLPYECTKARTDIKSVRA